jgi:hypothetical protein
MEINHTLNNNNNMISRRTDVNRQIMDKVNMGMGMEEPLSRWNLELLLSSKSMVLELDLRQSSRVSRRL